MGALSDEGYCPSVAISGATARSAQSGSCRHEHDDPRDFTGMGILACEIGDAEGWAFMDEVSSLIWSGGAWTEGTALVEAAARAGFDLADLDSRQEAEKDRLEGLIAENQAAQDPHHWGVPLMVFEGEAFFGQDRLDVLEWRLEQSGVQRRSFKSSTSSLTG